MGILYAWEEAQTYLSFEFLNHRIYLSQCADDTKNSWGIPQLSSLLDSVNDMLGPRD